MIEKILLQNSIQQSGPEPEWIRNPSGSEPEWIEIVELAFA